MGILRAALRAPYKHALTVAAIAVTMASLFVVSYTLALGRPKPREIPTALVGVPLAHRPLIADLERVSGSGLKLVPYPSVAAARSALAEQKVYAALLVSERPPRLLVDSAGGASVARVLTQAAAQSPRHVRVEDAHPLGPADPQGLVAFYVTLAATILGFVSMFQLRANASGLTLRGWAGFIAGIAVVAGLVMALVVGPLLGALTGSLPLLWAILSAQVAIAALFCSVMLTLVHRWAIIPTWGLFVLLGNTSSGGAVAPPLLPPFYAFVGRWLRSGATVEAIRTAVYFPHHQHAEPFLVLAAWLAAGIVAFPLVARLLDRGPTA